MNDDFSAKDTGQNKGKNSNSAFTNDNGIRYAFSGYDIKHERINMIMENGINLGIEQEYELEEGKKEYHGNNNDLFIEYKRETISKQPDKEIEQEIVSDKTDYGRKIIYIALLVMKIQK